MATNRQIITSVFTDLATLVGMDEQVLDTPGVDEILIEMKRLSHELKKVLG